MTQYENFIFYGSWKEHLDGLKQLCGEDVAKEVAWQIINYGTYKGFDTEDQNIINMVNGMCRDLIISAKKRRDASVTNGKQGGRPKTYNDEDIVNLSNQGKSPQEIADTVGCHVKTVRRILKAASTKVEDDDDWG